MASRDTGGLWMSVLFRFDGSFFPSPLYLRLHSPHTPSLGLPGGNRVVDVEDFSISLRLGDSRDVLLTRGAKSIILGAAVLHTLFSVEVLIVVGDSFRRTLPGAE